jgi:hypothetical protein
MSAGISSNRLPQKGRTSLSVRLPHFAYLFNRFTLNLIFEVHVKICRANLIVVR